jgi:hypothetical protein
MQPAPDCDSIWFPASIIFFNLFQNKFRALRNGFTFEINPWSINARVEHGKIYTRNHQTDDYNHPQSAPPMAGLYFGLFILGWIA